MAKHGFRVIDSDLHVIEPRTLWEDYLDPGLRGRITLAADADGQMRAQVDGKVLPPYADRPERQRAWSSRTRRPEWERMRRGTPPKAVLEAMDTEGDRKSTRLNSSHITISYAVFCLKKKKKIPNPQSIRQTFIVSDRDPSQILPSRTSS